MGASMSVDDLKLIPVVFCAVWLIVKFLGWINQSLPEETAEEWRERQW